jgi:hypothetical protein
LTKNVSKWLNAMTTDIDAQQEMFSQTERVAPSSGAASPPKNGRGGNMREGRLLNQLFYAARGGAAFEDEGADSGFKFC